MASSSFCSFSRGTGDLRRLFVEILFRRRVGESEGVDDVVEHLIFVGFVGVQLQAEVAEPDVLQSAVHDGKSRHFLRDEKHPASAHDVVGDDVGDGLRLARTGRSVQDETLGKTVVDSGILRAVRRDGQVHFLPADVRFVAAAVGEVEGAFRQFQPVVDEGGVRWDARGNGRSCISRRATADSCRRTGWRGTRLPSTSQPLKRTVSRFMRCRTDSTPCGEERSAEESPRMSRSNS